MIWRKRSEKQQAARNGGNGQKVKSIRRFCQLGQEPEWKKKYAPINAALATGKDFADRLIENSLYKKAIGFYAREQKAFKVKTVEYDEATGRKIKEFEELKTAEEVHYFEPDIKAIIFWLKNRKPDIWKEKVAEAMADDEGTGVIVLTPTQVEQISKEVKKDE